MATPIVLATGENASDLALSNFSTWLSRLKYPKNAAASVMPSVKQIVPENEIGSSSVSSPTSSP